MPTLLVPLDTSDAAPIVLRQATQLAKLLGAEMVLLHVVESVSSYVPVGPAMDVVVAPIPIDESGQIAAFQEHLEKLAASPRSEGIVVGCEVVQGLPVEEILEQAKLRNPEYVLLGSHGHGAIFHLFSGSVVTGVLRRSSCPVIVVPARGGG